MPYHVSLTHEDDVVVLRSLLQKGLDAHAKAPTSYPLPKLEERAYRRILIALEKASGTGIPGYTPPQPEPVEEPSAPKRTLEASALVLCGQHPNYTAKRAPRTHCVGCWAAYRRTHPRPVI